eukprot:05327.XXX_2106_2234_1 [CDS] Oithona nana genome sequencing.
MTVFIRRGTSFSPIFKAVCIFSGGNLTCLKMPGLMLVDVTRP